MCHVIGGFDGLHLEVRRATPMQLSVATVVHRRRGLLAESTATRICPSCGHQTSRRLFHRAHTCGVRLQAIYDPDDLRCGCGHACHQ